MISNINTNYKSLYRLFDFTNKKISNNKKILLSMAREKRSRPHYKTSLYAYLKSCTNKNNPLYDGEFSKNIRSLRPDWFVTKQSITKQKKDYLIMLAKKNKPRPNHLNKIYRDFCSYTNKRNKAYDEKFSNLVRKIRPDWFFTRSDLSAIKKQSIVKLAKQGKNKPSRKNVLGIAIKNYCSKSSPAYDKKFFTLIKKLKPDWFKK